MSKDKTTTVSPEAIAKIEADIRAKIAKEAALEKKIEKEKKIAEGSDSFLEFTVSGCYYDSRKETVDFEDIKIRIPGDDEEIGEMHVMSRYMAKAIRSELNKNGDPKFPKRVEKIRQVFVDDVVSTTGKLSFVGKNIKDLSVDEMQDLAAYKDLRFIPLPNAGLSKRDMLIRAYVAYCEIVLRRKIKYQEDGFNFAKLPAIILDGSGRIEVGEKITNEEMITQEQTATTTGYGQKDNPRDRFTIEELKTLADSKSVRYSADVEFKELYSQLFSA